MALPYPEIDPVIVHIGPFGVRWYAVAYLAGLAIGWQWMRRQVAKPPFPMRREQVDDFLTWATLGVVLGGRLGYVLFYKPLYYLQNPLEILAIYRGGMSFHGGALGVVLAVIIFCRRNKLDLLAVGDLLSTVVPIGLFFGRIANFINDELYGRAAPPDLPWAMAFPAGGPIPRHPSQLYEAGLEGAVLFIVLQLIWRREAWRCRRGLVSGAFLVGYGVARITGEFFRQPDAFLGYLWGGATMGQLLSLPLLVAGAILILRARPPA
jgi:phosphatidylglycerol:prolipoprotein diacylglycerol transferase